MTDYAVLSRATREWIELAAYAVGTPAPPSHEGARELRVLMEDHDDLAHDWGTIEDVLADRDFPEPADDQTTAAHVVELLENLAACREAFNKREEFDLVTGESAHDQDNPTGASRLQLFLAHHDELVRFRARVHRVLQDCGAVRGDIDDNRMVNILRMLMPQ